MEVDHIIDLVFEGLNCKAESSLFREILGL